MLGFLDACAKFVERFLTPFTQHRLWPTLYPWLVITLGLMSSINLPYIGAIIRFLFCAIALSLVLVTIWYKSDPRTMRLSWVCICQRHHAQFFERMMLATSILNFGMRWSPHLQVVSYRRGSLLEYIQREHAELTRRFKGTAGYLVTFDREAKLALTDTGVQIGGKKYKLRALRDLDINQNLRMTGLRLDDRAGMSSTAEEVAEHARAMFWGLSGVVIKQNAGTGQIGGLPPGIINQEGAFNLQAFIGTLNAGHVPTCPVYILNWPVLLWNLLAISVAGKAKLYLPDEQDATRKLKDELRLAAEASSVTVIDNPYVLMDAIEKDEQAIVIGGGSWLQSPQITVLPIASQNGPLFSKYMECLGYLLPEGTPSDPQKGDLNRLDSWVANRFRREMLMTKTNALDARVGLPCWVTRSELLGNLEASSDVEALDRVNPDWAEPLSIFEVE